jgi:hypothetical protein
MSSALVLVDNGLHLAQHEIRKLLELKEQREEDERMARVLRNRSMRKRKVTRL